MSHSAMTSATLFSLKSPALKESTCIDFSNFIKCRHLTAAIPPLRYTVYYETQGSNRIHGYIRSNKCKVIDNEKRTRRKPNTERKQLTRSAQLPVWSWNSYWVMACQT